ncbi:MAG TPA: hypothetical protein VNA04_12320 [Thermoanaerobaculia bacterium]|nr:hypothetical protein [Thermoanaerobaculia bacterium]
METSPFSLRRSAGATPLRRGVISRWTGEDGKVVIARVFPSAANYEVARQAFQAQYGGTPEEVDNVGEKAFYISGATGPLQTGTLVAQNGSTPVSVQVMGASGGCRTRY